MATRIFGWIYNCINYILNNLYFDNNNNTMTKNKQSSVALLGAMAMMSAQSAYTNAYEDLTDLDRPRSSVSYAKSKLTKKQVKSRAKSKEARKARKR